MQAAHAGHPQGIADLSRGAVYGFLYMSFTRPKTDAKHQQLSLHADDERKMMGRLNSWYTSHYLESYVVSGSNRIHPPICQTDCTKFLHTLFIEFLKHHFNCSLHFQI